MDSFLQDLRYGWRRLTSAPGFAAIALLTLAIGIGANTAIFTVVSSVLFRPLPFPAPDRVVGLFHTVDGELGSMSPPNLLDLADRTRTLEAAAGSFNDTMTLTGRGDPMRLSVVRVTARFFDVLQTPALYGRTLRPADTQTGQPPVALLSHALWRERFGANPAIVGSTITLNGQPHTIAGIMPEAFDYPAQAQAWLPAEYTEGFRTRNRGAWYIIGVGRLAPGQTVESAARELDTIGKQLEAEHPDKNTHLGLTLRPLLAEMVVDVRTALLVLLGAAGFVLLIACANVANLFLARAVHREGELAIRSALGGDRRRLVRQMLTESLVLATAGGLLGLVLAMWGTDFLVRLRPAGIPRFEHISIDPAVLLFTAAVTVLTGAIFGCLPAWQATRVSLVSSLKQGGRGVVGQSGVKRLRGALVVAEMALAVLLLAGAGLLIRSFLHLQEVDPGFTPTQALAATVALPEPSYDTEEKRAQFFTTLLDRLRSEPGVEAAGASSQPPMAGQWMNVAFWITGQPQRPLNETPSMEVRLVTPGYFAAAGVPLRRGRLFTDADVDGSRPVLLLNESAVRHYFPNEEPIGRHITIGMGRGAGKPRVNGDVVGVVADTKEMGLGLPAAPQLYVAYAQAPQDAMSIVLRTRVPPATLANAVRKQVRAIDPALAVYDVRTLDDLLGESVSQSRFYMLLLGTFAAAALLLAAIGIFGVMSNVVAHRTREIGIRLALGAQGAQVRQLVLREAFVLAGLGIAVGIALALPMTRLLGTLLFELAPGDPITLGGVVVILLGVALLASYLPAWRASRVDPLIALRAD